MQLDRLLAFLDQDPGNLSLIAEAATAALDANRLDVVGDLVSRYEAHAIAPAPLLNLAGLAALRNGQLDDAALRFEAALAQDPRQPECRFNLAWTRSILGDWAAVANLVDDAVVTAAPRAGALRVQALHQIGDPEDALAYGLGLVEHHPDDVDLMASLAVAAMDAEDVVLARRFAERARSTHEGLATLGLLELADDDMAAALELFDQAITVRHDSGRALLGKGLALLPTDAPQAAALLDRSAAVFGDHLGSWVASGWAWFAAGDLAQARVRFDRALQLDETFAEAHGALAAIDVVEGEVARARRGAEVALRLDRACLSGALAKVMLLNLDGDHQSATRLQEVALNVPIGPNGQTLAQAIRTSATRRH